MATYAISCDLNTPGRNYQPLRDELEKEFDAKRTLRSQWVFQRFSTDEAKLRNHFRQFIGTADRLWIVSLTNGNWASHNLMTDVSRLQAASALPSDPANRRNR